MKGIHACAGPPIAMTPPPLPCEECQARMREFSEHMQEIVSLSPQPCESCKAQFAAWEKGVGGLVPKG